MREESSSSTAARVEEPPLADFGPRFRVETVLGTGGFGSVYAAHDQLLSARVAVEQLRHVEPSAILEDLRAENRALKEQLDGRSKVAARALAAYQKRLEHLSEVLRSLEEKDRRLSEDLEQAHRFQARLLSPVPAESGVIFAAALRPAERVGGDLYDVSMLEPGRLRVFLAGAIGHGVQAALRTMILKSEYDRVKQLPSPEAALTALNRRLVELYPGLEMQCAAACLDVMSSKQGSGRVRFASAALPALIHLPTGGEPREHYRPGSLLGVDAVCQLEPDEFDLGAQDRVVLYTDGLVEERDGRGDSFGIEAIAQVLAAPAPLQPAVDMLLDRLLKFVGPRGLSNDATVVAVALS